MSSSFRQTLTCTRPSESGSYVKGVYVPGDTEEIEFEASVQPLRPEEMQTLSEGRREKQAFKLYTDYLLKTADNENAKNADVITISGNSFEVLSIAPWQNGICSHYKAIVVKID